MFDLNVTKVFRNINTKEDVYVVSIKLNNERYYNMNVTKSEFKSIYTRLKSIYENGGLD